MPIQNKPTEVERAEKRIGNVLADLEAQTNTEVEDISLEDLVETDPATGKPAVHKGVDITVNPRPERKWIR